MENQELAREYASQVFEFLNAAEGSDDYASRIDGLMLAIYSLALAHTERDVARATKMLHDVVDELGRVIAYKPDRYDA